MGKKAVSTEEQSRDNLRRLDRATGELQERQSKGLVIDFDESLQESRTKARPIIVRLGGREYALPASMPVRYMAFHNRHLRQVDGVWKPEFSEGETQQMLEAVFGVELLEQMCEAGVTVQAMEAAMIQIVTQWWQSRIDLTGTDIEPEKKGNGSTHA